MKKTIQKEQKSKKIDPSLLFIAFIIIGSGIGMALDNVAIGATIGVGVGFLAKALIK